MGRPKGSVNRPKRKPFDGHRNTLTFDDRDPNYVYRVFNDTEGRIKRAEEAGYEVVRSSETLGDETAESSHQVGSVVTRPVGGGQTGVLMRIKREWYEEDQAQKQTRNDDIDDALRNAPNKDGRYGKVEINRR